MELIAHVAEFREIREVKCDIRILRVAFKHFEGACPFRRMLGQLALVWCKVLSSNYELIYIFMVLTWSSVLVGIWDLVVLGRVDFICCCVMPLCLV